MLHELHPSVGRHVHHCSQKLQCQVGILSASQAKLNIEFHVIFKCCQTGRVELSDIAANFEEERILEFECTLEKLLVLIFLSNQLSITRIGSQVYGKRNQLFTDNGLRAVNNKLVHNRNTLSVSKSGFKLIFLRQMVQKFQDEGAEARCLKDLNQFWNHTAVVDLHTNFCVKSQVE